MTGYRVVAALLLMAAPLGQTKRRYTFLCQPGRRNMTNTREGRKGGLSGGRQQARILLSGPLRAPGVSRRDARLVVVSKQ